MTSISNMIAEKIEQRKELESQLGGTSHKDKEERDNIFKDVKKLNEKIKKLQEEQEKQKALASIKPETFLSLQTALTRSHEFFPNNELFDEDLVYFPGNEWQKITEMRQYLTETGGGRMYLLYGNPASGKTVMGFATAKEMEKRGYVILYHKLTDQSDIDRLWADIENFGDLDVLFIIDDCHLNIKIAAEIYQWFDSIKTAACLYISRELPKNLRIINEILPDIFDELDETSYRMDVERDEQVKDKMAGIISKRQSYYERTKKREFIVGDEDQVIKNVRRNYLTLYFYLFFWPKVSQLDQLDERAVLKKVYARYLDIKDNKSFRDVLLKYAVLYQYEIQFRPAPGDEKSIKAIANRGLLEYSDDTEYYSFHHSDFAKLLLASFFSRPSFEEKHSTSLDFTITKIKEYITSFKNYPQNLDEIFKNLVVNQGVQVFRELLNDNELQELTISYFKKTDSAYNLYHFLSFVYQNAEEQVEIYALALIIDNPAIKNLFLKNKDSLPPCIQILKILKNINQNYHDVFLDFFNIEGIKTILLNAPFHVIGRSLNILAKSDMSTSQTLLDAVPTPELLKEARQADYHNLGRALNELKNIDYAKAKYVFEHIELELLIEKAKQVSFNSLGKALNELKNIDPVKARHIFEQIEPEFLMEKAKHTEFHNLMESLNTLKNIDSKKAKYVFEHIELELLIEKAKQVSFNRFGYALNSLKNIDPKKAKTIFDHIEPAILVEKAKHSEFHNLMVALNELKNIDPGKAKLIFEKIEPGLLIERAKEVSFNRLGKALNELKNIDPKKAKTIFDHIEPAILVEKAKHSEFHNLMMALNELKNIDPGKAKHIFEQIEPGLLIEKAKQVSFESFGYALNSLKNIDPGKAKHIFEQIEPGLLIEKAKQVSFERFGKALNELKNIDPQKAKTIFNHIEPEIIVEKAKEVSFGRLGEALNELKSVDPIKAKQIFKQIEPEIIVEKAKQVSFGRLGKALNELKNIDPGKAKYIFDQIELEILVEKAEQVSFKKFGNALSSLVKVDFDKSAEILRKIDPSHIISKILQEKYTVLLQYIPVLARIDGPITRRLLEKIPYKVLFDYEKLKNLFNFNPLFFALHYSELTEYVKEMVEFAKLNIDGFMRIQSLRNIAGFLNLYSHHADIKPIIRQYRNKFFGKMEYGEEEEIPYFIEVIYKHDKELTLKLLDYIEKEIGRKVLIGSCYYRIGKYLYGNEDFEESTDYLKKALPLFPEPQYNEGIASTHLYIAKNEDALNNLDGALEHAKKALPYAAELPILEKEIEDFISKIENNKK